MISRGARNAFRNIIRTGSIVIILGISIGLALSMLVARQAVTTKIETVKSSVGNTVTVAPAGARGFEGGGEPLTVEQATKLASIDHVASTVQSVSDRLTTDNTDLESGIDAGSLGRRNAARSGVGFEQAPPSMPSGGMGGGQGASGSGAVTRTFTPPVTLIGSNSPEKSLASDGTSVEITAGEVFSSDSTEKVAIIGKALADKNELTVGSTFTAYGETIKVVAIYDTGTDFANNQVVMPLTIVQTLSDQTNQLTSITLNVDSVDNISSVNAAAKTAIGDSGDVTDSESQVASAVEPLQNIQTISLYSLIGAVFAGAIIILLTMIMIVRERRREIGVIKAIGGSNTIIMGQFIVEAVTLTLLGALIGIGVGVAAAAPITSALVSTSNSTAQTGGPGGMMGGGRGAGRALQQSVENIQANVGWEIILYGIGAALIIAIIGSALASIFISKVRPAEVMRAE